MLQSLPQRISRHAEQDSPLSQQGQTVFGDTGYSPVDIPQNMDRNDDDTSIAQEDGKDRSSGFDTQQQRIGIAQIRLRRVDIE